MEKSAMDQHTHGQGSMNQELGMMAIEHLTSQHEKSRSGQLDLNCASYQIW
jgi:hypothetical protein